MCPELEMWAGNNANLACLSSPLAPRWETDAQSEQFAGDAVADGSKAVRCKSRIYR